MDVEVTV